MAAYSPAGPPPGEEIRFDLTFWFDLLDEYWKTLPWTTRLKLSVCYLFPKLHIDWEDFKKWLDKKFLV